MELKKENLLEKYGGAEHLDAPQALLLSQSEVYQEFNPTDGRYEITVFTFWSVGIFESNRVWLSNSACALLLL